MLGKCEKAPNGYHCTHEPRAGWYGLQPPPETCCWCGEVVRRHGPFAPDTTGGTKADYLQKFWEGDGWCPYP